jgi:uncharacterized membrane protein
MNALRYLLLWVCSFAFTSLLDALWHFAIFGRAYSRDIRPLARMSGDKLTFNPGAGFLAQVMVVTSLVFLVLYKSTPGNLGEAALVGAVAGILAISVYGVTNYALFKDWSLALAVLEFVWGPILGALSGVFVLWFRTVLNP